MPEIDITVNSAAAVNAVQNFNKSVDDMGQTVQAAGGKTDELESGLGRLWQSFAIGSIAANVVTNAVSFMKTSFEDCINQAAAYEKAVVGLNAAFSLSGRTMPGMTDDLKKYAEQLRSLGLITTTEAITTESLAMQLTNLNKEGIEQVTRGAIGLADVFGMGLQQAVEMLSRGMEGQYLALNRLFPAIRNATGEGEKHAALMKIMEDLYGRAIADTETYSGQVKKMGIEWIDAKRSLGEAILATGILQKGIEDITIVLDKLSGQSILKAKQEYKDWQVAQGELYDALLKLGGPSGALGKNEEWVKKLADTYGYSYDALLHWIHEGGAMRDELDAMTAVLRAHGIAVGVARQGYTETGLTLEQLLAQWNKGRTTLDDWTNSIIKDSKAITELSPFLFILEENERECNREIETSNREFDEQQKVLGRLTPAMSGFTRGLIASLMDPFKDMNKPGLLTYLKAVQAELALVDANTPVNKIKTLEEEAGAATNMLNIMAAAGMQSLKNWRIAVNMLGTDLQQLSTDMRGHSHLVGLMMKAVAMAQASINTDEAVTKALAQGGFIFGIPMASVVKALGLAQVALIAAEPIPAAKGFEGMVSGPTTFLAGEAGREYVSIRPTSQGGGGGGLVMNFNAPIMTVTRLSDSQINESVDKIFSAMERGAHKRGFSITKRVGRA